MAKGTRKRKRSYFKKCDVVENEVELLLNLGPQGDVYTSFLSCLRVVDDVFKIAVDIQASNLQGVGDQEAVVLFCTLSRVQNLSLVKLNFCNTALGDEGLMYLLNFLDKSRDIGLNINISQTNITEEGLSLLACYLQRQERIFFLDLRDNRCIKKSLDRPLKIGYFSKASSVTWQVFFSSLKRNQQLKYLDVRNNNISVDTIIEFLMFIHDTKLEHFHFNPLSLNNSREAEIDIVAAVFFSELRVKTECCHFLSCFREVSVDFGDCINAIEKYGRASWVQEYIERAYASELAAIVGE